MSACAEAKASFRHICLEVGLTEEQFDFFEGPEHHNVECPGFQRLWAARAD